MAAQYLYNEGGVSIYTDFSLLDDEDRTKSFMDLLAKVEGVEAVRSGRYVIDAAFGLMFEPEDVIDRVLISFKTYFDIPAVGMFDYATITSRRLRVAKETMPEIVDMFNFQEPGPGDEELN